MSTDIIVVEGDTEDWVLAWYYGQKHPDRMVTDVRPGDRPGHWVVAYLET